MQSEDMFLTLLSQISITIKELQTNRFENLTVFKAKNIKHAGIFTGFPAFEASKFIEESDLNKLTGLKSGQLICLWQEKHKLCHLVQVSSFSPEEREELIKLSDSKEKELKPLDTMLFFFLVPLKEVDGKFEFFSFEEKQTEIIESKLAKAAKEENEFAQAVLDKLVNFGKNQFSFMYIWLCWLNFLNEETRQGISFEDSNTKTKIFNATVKVLNKILEKIDSEKAQERMNQIISESSRALEILEENILQIKDLPDNVRTILFRELEILKRTNPATQEYNHTMNYINTVMGIPFNIYSGQEIEPENLLNKLKESHYGLDEVKELMIEHINLQSWSDKNYGEAICLIGPPGVGKSSIANTLAKELGRKYIKMALGGLSDENDIRGFKRTYLNSSPGRLISGFIKARTLNPVVVLDEIDKLVSYRGSPSDAFLEILDPEQNTHYVDRYLDFGLDISNSMFICTANSANGIPPALLDRMNVIKIDGYSKEEQIEILKKYIIPKYTNDWNLKNISIDDSLIHSICSSQKEGVRRIEREIQTILRKGCLLLKTEKLSELEITSQNIDKLFKFQSKKQFGAGFR